MDCLAVADEPVSAQFNVSAARRSTQVFLLPDGPITLVGLEVEPSPQTVSGWESARLRLTWETDDPTPSRAAVDLPLGWAFGRGDRSSSVASTAVNARGDTWVLRFRMPYRTRAILCLETTTLGIDGRIRVRAIRGTDGNPGYFHGRYISGKGHFELVNAPGRLAGLLLSGPTGAIEGCRLKVKGSDVALIDAASPSDAGRLSDGTAGRSVLYRWWVADGPTLEPPLTLDTAGATVDTVYYWYSNRPEGGG